MLLQISRAINNGLVPHTWPLGFIGQLDTSTYSGSCSSMFVFNRYSASCSPAFKFPCSLVSLFVSYFSLFLLGVSLCLSALFLPLYSVFCRISRRVCLTLEEYCSLISSRLRLVLPSFCCLMKCVRLKLCSLELTFMYTELRKMTQRQSKYPWQVCTYLQGQSTETLRK